MLRTRAAVCLTLLAVVAAPRARAQPAPVALEKCVAVGGAPDGVREAVRAKGRACFQRALARDVDVSTIETSTKGEGAATQACFRARAEPGKEGATRALLDCLAAAVGSAAPAPSAPAAANPRDQAMASSTAADAALDRGDARAAIRLAEESVAAFEKLEGRDGQDLWGPLDTLASALFSVGEYARARDVTARELRALARAKAAGTLPLMPGSPDVVAPLDDIDRARIRMDTCLLGMGRLDDAEAALRKTLASPADGDSRPRDAEVLMALGDVASARSDWAEAVVRYERAGAADPTPSTTVRVDLALGTLERRLGRAEDARQHLAAVRDAYGAGAKDDTYAFVVAELAAAEAEAGDPRASESDAGEALDVVAPLEKTVRDAPPAPVASSLLAAANAGAISVSITFNHGAPAPPASDASHEDVPPPAPDPRRVALTLSELGVLADRRGDFDAAEGLLQRALELDRHTFGDDHPVVAADRDHLGVLLFDRGRYDEAVPLHERAIAVLTARGREDAELAVALGNLAAAYDERRDFARAEPLHARASAVFERLGPSAAVLLASARYNEATALREHAEHDPAAAKGLFARAADLDHQALDARRRLLGDEHPDVGLSWMHLALLAFLQGDSEGAASALATSEDVRERNVALVTAVGSEAERVAYLDSLARQADLAVTLGARPGAPPSAVRLAANAILRRKGRALDAMADDLARLRARADDAGRAALEEYAAARREVAALVLAADGATDRARIDAAKARLARAEANVGAKLGAAPSGALVAVEEVARAVPQGAALVELYAYRPFQADPSAPKWGAPRYAAIVVAHDAPPWSVDLGAQAEIDAAAAAMRAALAEPARDDWRGPARALDERVLRPLRAHLPPRGRILLSPDGALDLVPFAAFVDENGQTLVDRYSIVELTTGRDLLRAAAPRVAAREAPVVVADPAFGPHRPPEPAGDATRSALARAFFPPLPGTAAEGAAVAKLLAGATLLAGPRATKAALAALHGPRVLHVATHGFFLGAPSAPPADDTRALVLDDGGARPAARTRSPLLDSGLALAGANARPVENGVLTALEAAALDLDGTALVVLSACETGVGETRGAEGVYGLRRAMVLAGAESQVTSLWKVDDDATRDLMVAFYGALARGRGRDEALRDAQLAIREDAHRAHPYYWASFVPIGEFRTLDGRDDPVRDAAQPMKVAPGACGCRAAGEKRGAGAAVTLLALALAQVARRRRQTRQPPSFTRPRTR